MRFAAVTWGNAGPESDTGKNSSGSMAGARQAARSVQWPMARFPASPPPGARTVAAVMIALRCPVSRRNGHGVSRRCRTGLGQPCRLTRYQARPSFLQAWSSSCHLPAARVIIRNSYVASRPLSVVYLTDRARNLMRLLCRAESEPDSGDGSAVRPEGEPAGWSWCGAACCGNGPPESTLEQTAGRRDSATKGRAKSIVLRLIFCAGGSGGTVTQLADGPCGYPGGLRRGEGIVVMALYLVFVACGWPAGATRGASRDAPASADPGSAGQSSPTPPKQTARR